MESNQLAASATFVLVSMITPGPNNMMLASSGMAFGFRRTVPLLLGIQVGFQSLLISVAAGLGVVFQRYPAAQWAMRCIGAIYLIHLAVRLWNAASATSSAVNRPIGFLRGCVFQIINPKAWMMSLAAIGAYAGSREAYWPSVGRLVVLFFVLGLPAITLWVVCGSVFRTAVGQSDASRWISRSLAVLTGLSYFLVFL